MERIFAIRFFGICLKDKYRRQSTEHRKATKRQRTERKKRRDLCARMVLDNISIFYVDYQKLQNLPNNLKRYRRILGLTQKEVGERPGIILTRVSHWENGVTAEPYQIYQALYVI